MTTSDVAARIKQAVDAVDLIGQVVPLRRVGRRHVGLCPFHREKTPSFQVDGANGLFYCFGCGAGGDVITFTMRHWNLSFAEAIRFLADRYHVPLPENQAQRPRTSSEDPEVLLHVLEEACRFYYSQLHHGEAGLEARRYVRSRGLPPHVVEEQRLGYAPDAWDALLRHFRRRRLDVDAGQKAGLFIPSSKGTLYDRFRNRLIFPITNSQGKVVAFGGRSLDGSEPKYLNSPETPVYHKRRMLYQTALARQACKDQRQVLLVEGYMDLLAFHAQGFYRVVATLGTALTPQQVRLLRRMADEVVLVYDGDAAGQKAMIRSFPLFAREGLAASCLVLPDGMDPDDFLKEHGLSAFLELLEQRRELAAFVVETHLATWDGTSQDKSRVLREVKDVVHDLPDPVLREEVLRRLSESLQLPQSVVRQQLFPRRSRFIHGSAHVERTVPTSDIRSHEETIVRILLLHPDLALEPETEKALEVFEASALRTLAETIVRVTRDHGPDGDPSLMVSALSDDQARSLLTRFLLEREEMEMGREEARALLEDRARMLRQRHRKKRLRQLQIALAQADQGGDPQKRRHLLQEYQALCAATKRG